MIDLKKEIEKINNISVSIEKDILLIKNNYTNYTSKILYKEVIDFRNFFGPNMVECLGLLFEDNGELIITENDFVFNVIQDEFVKIEDLPPLISTTEVERDFMFFREKDNFDGNFDIEFAFLARLNCFITSGKNKGIKFKFENELQKICKKRGLDIKETENYEEVLKQNIKKSDSPTTIFDESFKVEKSDFEFDYQENLTKKLDANNDNFTQNTINEIILWKVNRYANFDKKILSLINSISPKDREIDINKTKEILKLLLDTKGVQLVMASTILRFRNEHIYQIIDQRVYRMIYPNEVLSISSYKSEVNTNKAISIYLNYLCDLKKVCENLNIPFEKSDRILYMADKRVNKNHKLRNS